MDCIFCRIVAGEIPAEVVYQDDEFLSFWDIHPQAPTHVLIIPKSHIPSLNEVTDGQEGLLCRGGETGEGHGRGEGKRACGRRSLCHGVALSSWRKAPQGIEPPRGRR